jgi:hypothetical protein
VYNCVTINPVCKDVWGKGCLVMHVRPARVFVLTVSIPHGFRFLYVCVCVRARASVFMLRGTQWPLVLCFFCTFFLFLSFQASALLSPNKRYIDRSYIGRTYVIRQY